MKLMGSHNDGIDGIHIRIKKIISNHTDYINRKGTYSLNVPAAVD